MLNDIQKRILQEVADLAGIPDGAVAEMVRGLV